jgi:threonine synthase
MSLTKDALCPKCGFTQLVSVEYDESIQENVTHNSIENSRVYNMWRYSEFLPIDLPDVVSLNEGFTPLVRLEELSKNSGVNFLAKNDTVNPTGSFKDRGSSTLISWLRKNKVKRIAVPSSGNFASSMAAYAARAGIKGYVLVPSDAGLGKIVQSLFHGSTVITSSSDLQKIIEEHGEEIGIHLCSHSPISWEGPKTIGYEVSEQLKWNPPDWFVFPSGTCTGITGCWKGFKDFHRLDLIPRIPRIICISPQGAPIVDAFKRKSKEIKSGRSQKTIAGPIGGGGSGPRGQLALDAIYETKGLAEEVSDEEIIEAAKYLAKTEGLFVEPSSAASVAGSIKLVDQGLIDKGDVVVCILTGSGFKTLDKYEEYVEKPVQIEASKEALKLLFVTH